VAFELFADYERSGPSTPRISAKLLRHGFHKGPNGSQTPRAMFNPYTDLILYAFFEVAKLNV
jgi:hypothetical protein